MRRTAISSIRCSPQSGGPAQKLSPFSRPGGQTSTA
jgi:hypothetical protein